jgi:hypothetical protein
MSLTATLALAAAAGSGPAQVALPVHGVELAEARVRVEILSPAIVRQSSGPQQSGDRAPRHQLSRRGNTVLVEFQ